MESPPSPSGLVGVSLPGRLESRFNGFLEIYSIISAAPVRKKITLGLGLVKCSCLKSDVPSTIWWAELVDCVIRTTRNHPQ